MPRRKRRGGRGLLKPLGPGGGGGLLGLASRGLSVPKIPLLGGGKPVKLRTAPVEARVYRRAVAAAGVASERSDLSILSGSYTVGLRSSLQRMRPRNVLEDVALTGGEWGRVSRQLYRTAYERMKVEESIRRLLADTGFTLKDFQRVARKLYKGAKLTAEEEELVLLLGGAETVKTLYSQYRTATGREEELLRIREDIERRLSYEAAHPDEIARARVRELVGAAKSAPAAARKGLETVKAGAEVVARGAAKLKEVLRRRGALPPPSQSSQPSGGGS